MKILVCIKQIPDTNDVRWSKDNNIIREGVISVLNGNDVYGIMSALEIKKKLKEVEISLISMGPMNAEKSLLYGLSLGADKAYLLTDKCFIGSDTLISARALSYAIKALGGFDLIITGQFASDGDTAQTPYSLANLLQIPNIGYVNSIKEVDESHIVVKSVKDNGIYEIKGKFPILISVSNFEGEIYKPKAIDWIRAQNTGIQILDSNKIGADCDLFGVKGSPTYVSKAFRPETKRDCRFISKEELKGEINE